ncbi:N-acetylmuramoyl-L-alanine amidase [Pseudoduganella albidiflava]|uniref:N-acetylmuramoyl-L-alanine amidase n=1 Tax=Pseudoduganella albidiflava TaxID=321983 RepID=A0A411X675_9BURK|nr:N-acetylmuramoyl-L-alanine amidase [Pseudoduganella albidiflava]QBI04507.1 N-acetylmuramoyl-L-alanine amidase [Pseudoduganella albidiflava]GGY27849.1 protein AmpDh2 [Pseudoduganella albidiflava]
MTKILLATLLAAALAGCATTPPAPPYKVDHSLTAKGQASRVRFIVLHYTVSDLPRSIMLLTEKEVSAHYLLTDEPQPKFYALVDEKNAAWHAGLSNWKNFTNLNYSSIGIEIVNPGFTLTPDGRRQYHPFAQAQIDQLIPLLKDLVKRHNVAPENILAHSDIAPQRKQDPGPLFPWKQLADAGLVLWPDAGAVAQHKARFEAAMPDIAWFQKKLAQHGYAVPNTGVLDEATHNTLMVFQTKYRQSNWDGWPDAESAAILEVLTTPKPAPQPVPAAAAAAEEKP